MTHDHKRELVAQILAGNLEGLRAYQTKTQQQDLTIRWVVDTRPSGGPIKLIQKDGSRKTITPQEFEALPAGIIVWEIQDQTGGAPVPAPDEDYHS